MNNGLRNATDFSSRRRALLTAGIDIKDEESKPSPVASGTGAGSKNSSSRQILKTSSAEHPPGPKTIRARLDGGPQWSKFGFSNMATVRMPKPQAICIGPLSQVTKRSQFEIIAARSLGAGSKTIGMSDSKASRKYPKASFSSGPTKVITFRPCRYRAVMSSQNFLVGHFLPHAFRPPTKTPTVYLPEPWPVKACSFFLPSSFSVLERANAGRLS